MNMARKLKLASLFAVSFAVSLSASANVSLKNGNFFIGYTDILYSGGFDPKIDRVYNSKTPYKGIFGWGWGNEYEVYMTVSADGSVVVHEYGGGAENRFSPVGFKAEDLKKAVDALIAADRGVGGSKEQIASYRQRLMTDATYRNDEWERLIRDNRIKPRDLPNGTQLYSNHFSYQYITKVADGYVRAFENGRIEKFDLKGRLVRISDKNNNFIGLSYAKNGQLEKLTDNFNRKMFFTFDSKGRLAKIQGESGKLATYKYNDLDELIESKDTEGNIYAFKYSSDGRHNLTQVRYSDKTTLDIAYYPRDKHENVKSVKERDGTTTEYAYDTDSSDRNHLKIAVNVKGSDGKSISSSNYEYYIRNKADGEEWTYKMIATIDGDRTETTYNECCGEPVAIKKNGQETDFQYDTKGHVTRKTTPTEVTNLQYDRTLGKVARVERTPRVGKAKTHWSTFQYDNKGNLTLAKNSDGKGVKLFYDSNGRIASMVDQDRRTINFKYNENSKPIAITDPALGTINVSYTNSGEIQKVDSTAGRKIAQQVTSAFTNLLEIIRPAGVSLSF